MWNALKEDEIPAERQWELLLESGNYFLDFAIFCEKGFVDVETDGDSYHIGVEQSKSDNLRNNHLESNGWHVLRFNTQAILEQMKSYCIPTIKDMTDRLGGISDVLMRKPNFLHSRAAFSFDRVSRIQVLNIILRFDNNGGSQIMVWHLPAGQAYFYQQLM